MIPSMNMEKLFQEEEVIGEGATEGTPLSILYQYLIEGLLPCLSTFAKEYKTLWEPYKDKLTDEPRQPFVEKKRLLKTFGLEMEVLVCVSNCVQWNLRIMELLGHQYMAVFQERSSENKLWH